MESVLLILPDFLVVLLGIALARKLGWPRDFWKEAEKLVFYVLFPPLLFTSILQSKLVLGDSAQFLAVGLSAMGTGVLAARLLRPLFPKTDDVSHASIFQCGFRFNTYIGFSICTRIFDESGFALLALLIAFWVPISNTIAVTAIARAVARRDGGAARRGGSALRAVVTNPLILATVLGLAGNLAGLTLPAAGARFLEHLGDASLAMGLLCVGAGMTFGSLRQEMPVLAASAFLRLMVLPAIAFVFGWAFGLDPVSRAVLLLFAALPASQTCYVMTAAMGGNGPMVANLTTLQTLAAMATLPFWVSVMLAVLGH